MNHRWVKIRDEVLKQEGGREILFSGRPDNQGVPWISDNIKRIVQVGYSGREVGIWHAAFA
jgi:hypothetical protein